MYVARQLQYAPKPRPHVTAIAHAPSNSRRGKPRSQSRQRKEGGDAMQIVQPNLQTPMGVGEIDFQMICRYLELAHAEIRRIMKRNRMTLRSGAFKGDGMADILSILLLRCRTAADVYPTGLAESLLTDVLHHFNARLMALMSSIFAGDSFTGGADTSNLRIEFMNLSRYVAEQTICALLDLERRLQAGPAGRFGRARQVPNTPVATQLVARCDKPMHSAAAKCRVQTTGVPRHRVPDVKRNRPKAKGKPVKKATSLSSATTAVPGSPFIAPTPQTRPKPVRRAHTDPVRPRTSSTTPKPPVMRAMSLDHVHTHPPLAPVPASNDVPGKPKPERNAVSILSWPSDSTPLGEIPAHKLARPLHSRSPEAADTTTTTTTTGSEYSRSSLGSKPGFWRRWIKK
jgi:hypothetical protein